MRWRRVCCVPDVDVRAASELNGLSGGAAWCFVSVEGLLRHRTPLTNPEMVCADKFCSNPAATAHSSRKMNKIEAHYDGSVLHSMSVRAECSPQPIYQHLFKCEHGYRYVLTLPSCPQRLHFTEPRTRPRSGASDASRRNLHLPTRRAIAVSF